ncbi:hypothetical protein P171DRAFT_472086 [Karstenula rhodostoma CBS 690.94]|uniref:Secreted protein n=1 Tax=Karstenula rhodostoma CBS 690.94 TaxID=1392251 RepID=A0A9P4PK87_9PLEO|nr:hypothetical protein P171DRAFT_472086 [Karstenula rhodostoma CBS 690.94]
MTLVQAAVRLLLLAVPFTRCLSSGGGVGASSRGPQPHYPHHTISSTPAPPQTTTHNAQRITHNAQSMQLVGPPTPTEDSSPTSSKALQNQNSRDAANCWEHPRRGIGDLDHAIGSGLRPHALMARHQRCGSRTWQAVPPRPASRPERETSCLTGYTVSVEGVLKGRSEPKYRKISLATPPPSSTVGAVYRPRIAVDNVSANNRSRITTSLSAHKPPKP